MPLHRFNKILYVEKTGFMQQLLAANIHTRFDVAIAAGAGFSPQAAKELFAKIEQTIPVSVYVLHDADIAGLEIAWTLGTELVHEEYAVTVEDLGLRPAEAMELQLPTERVEIAAEPSWELKRSVSQEELAWLLGENVTALRHWKKSRQVRYVGNRAELNAFTPREFIAWVESKFQSLAGKIIPDEETIKREVDQQYQNTLRTHITEALLVHFDLDALRASLPAPEGLHAEQIHQHLDAAPALSWREVIKGKAEEAVQRLDIRQRVQAFLNERNPGVSESSGQ